MDSIFDSLNRLIPIEESLIHFGLRGLFRVEPTIDEVRDFVRLLPEKYRSHAMAILDGPKKCNLYIVSGKYLFLAVSHAQAEFLAQFTTATPTGCVRVELDSVHAGRTPDTAQTYVLSDMFVPRYIGLKQTTPEERLEQFVASVRARVTPLQERMQKLGIPGFNLFVNRVRYWLRPWGPPISYQECLIFDEHFDMFKDALNEKIEAITNEC